MLATEISCCCMWLSDGLRMFGISVELMPMQMVHNVAVAGQRPLTLVLHSVGRFTTLQDLSVALFRSYGADNFFASLPPSLTRLRASGVAGFKVISPLRRLRDSTHLQRSHQRVLDWMLHDGVQ